MSEAFSLENLRSRMKKSIDSMKSDLAGLRTGRASASLLEPITVDAYGSSMPLNQVATISVPEPRIISVNVWDRGLVQSVDRAIRESDLGLNPVVEGQILRIPIPELNAERRQEIVKVAHKYSEQARIAVRHVRRDGMERLKRLEKEHEIGQDEHHALADEVAHITRGMRQREPVEVDHGHPIAQDVDILRLEVSVSRHDLSRVQRLQGGEYALGEALHPRRKLRADPHQDIPVGVKLHLFVLHRQDGDAGYSGFVQFRQPARRKAHRL
jgi:ribosome recycling factor